MYTEHDDLIEQDQTMIGTRISATNLKLYMAIDDLPVSLFELLCKNLKENGWKITKNYNAWR